MKLLYQYLCSLGNTEQQAADAVEKFRVYRDFLREKNEEFNLTAITDPAEVETKHFIDSLTGVPYIEGSVADIGTGAGFPGMALKIALPDTPVTLIDSLQKRISFLNNLIEKLAIKNCTAVHARAEDLPKDILYDTVVARAVSSLPTLAEYCLPFVKKGGLFLAYKAADCDEEIKSAQNAFRILGGTVEAVRSVSVYGTDIVRTLVCIRKTADTPIKYPRGQNKPKKQPLR